MRAYEVMGKQGDHGKLIFDVDEYVVHLYFELNSPILQRIDEAKHKGDIELGGQYSAKKHNGHIADGKHHLHIYAGQYQIAAVNIDGTGHDGYSGTKLPNKVANAIRDRFPDFNIPNDNVVESLTRSKDILLKLEF